MVQKLLICPEGGAGGGGWGGVESVRFAYRFHSLHSLYSYTHILDEHATQQCQKIIEQRTTTCKASRTNINLPP